MYLNWCSIQLKNIRLNTVKSIHSTSFNSPMTWFMLVLLGVFCLNANAQQDPLDIVGKTNVELAESQQHIDQLDSETRKMLQEYRAILQQKDYQQYYNFQLKQLQAAQQQEITALETQLEELEYIEVAIMPLMQSMLVALEEFVALDIPFHRVTRQDGLQKLRSRINSGSLPLPDKYRLLMEAWQIEHDYGRSTETWRGRLSDSTGQSSDEQMSVDYLRIGRIAFYYLSLDEQQLAIWDKQTRHWQTLPPHFAADLRRSIQVASKKIAPELLPLPLPANGALSQ